MKQSASSVSRGGAKKTRLGQGKPSRDGLGNKKATFMPIQSSAKRTTPASSKAPKVNNRRTRYMG